MHVILSSCIFFEVAHTNKNHFRTSTPHVQTHPNTSAEKQKKTITRNDFAPNDFILVRTKRNTKATRSAGVTRRAIVYRWVELEESLVELLFIAI